MFVPLQPIDLPPFSGKVQMLRLDLMREWASGNKYFKLQYFIEKARCDHVELIVSKGGMFSNHLEALAKACTHFNLKLVCLVRSHAPDEKNPTIAAIRSSGAEVRYVDPRDYEAWDQELVFMEYGNAMFIPEGGLHPLGILGAEGIAHLLPEHQALHLVLPAGSMCTALGILASPCENMKLTIVPAWKGCTEKYIEALLQQYEIRSKIEWNLWPDFHFGGFGKVSDELFQFMMNFTSQSGIPLDPVYNGKMMYALRSNLEEGSLSDEGTIIAIHTGGLQGIAGYAYRYPDPWQQYQALVEELE